MPAIAAAAITFLFLGAVGQARASQLRRLAASVASFSSDGARYVAWQTGGGGPLLVFDTRTGRRKTMTLPRGCNLDAEGGSELPSEQTGAAGRFLITCGTGQQEHQMVLDVESGASVALPGAAEWFRLGTRYVESPVGGGEAPAVVEDLATGKVRAVHGAAVIELDRARVLTPRNICHSLRRRIRKLGGLSFFGLGFDYEDGALVREHGERGAVEIDHCRGRPIVLRGQTQPRSLGSRFPKDFDLRAGLLTWDDSIAESSEDEAEVRSFPPTLRAYSLKTGSRDAWVLPQLPPLDPTGKPGKRGAWGHSTHTANAVFWVATAAEGPSEDGGVPDGWSVYWARL